MKEQRFALIDNNSLKLFNNDGWFVKQVIERRKGGMLCEPEQYYVLLERSVHDE